MAYCFNVKNVGNLVQISAMESGVQVDKEVVRNTTAPTVSIDGNQAIINNINRREAFNEKK